MLTLSESLTLETVLTALSRERLYDLARVMGAGVRETKSTKASLVRTLGTVLGAERLPTVLQELGRDELRAVCRAHDADGATSQRPELIEALLKASGHASQAAGAKGGPNKKPDLPGEASDDQGSLF
ncbi:MAG: hypothetical protein RJA70_1866 [Pseudomonadota bacterium]|jgi:Sec-independent protein translocase protein TatA